MIHVLEDGGTVFEGEPAVGACGGHRVRDVASFVEISESSLPTLLPTAMSQTTDVDPLTRITLLMNDILLVILFSSIAFLLSY